MQNHTITLSFDWTIWLFLVSAFILAIIVNTLNYTQYTTVEAEPNLILPPHLLSAIFSLRKLNVEFGVGL